MRRDSAVFFALEFLIVSGCIQHASPTYHARGQVESRKMAQKVLVQLVDDLDGTSSEDISTVTFGLDGAEYEIELSDRNAENLRKELEEYVAAARRTGGRRRRVASPNGAQANQGEAGVIREWARENGYELAARGRIPGHVIEAYNVSRTEPKPVTRKTSRKK